MPLVVGVGVGGSFGGLAEGNPRPAAARISILGMTPQMVPLKAGTSRALAVRSSAPMMAPIPVAAQISLSGKAVFIRPLPAAAVLAVQATAPKPILLAPSAARLAIEGMAPAPASYPSNPNPAFAYLELRQGGAPQVSPLRAGASRSLVMRGGNPPILSPIPAAARLVLTGRPAFISPIPVAARLSIHGATPKPLGLRPASAQLAITGFAPVPTSTPAGGLAVTATYKETTSRTNHSFTADIGDAAPDRLVIVAIAVGGTNISSVTIGGNAATIHCNGSASGFQSAAIASLSVASGTTADIVITTSSSDEPVEAVVYAATGLSSTTPTGAVASTGHPISLSCAVAADGFLIGVAHGGDAQGAFSTNNNALQTVDYQGIDGFYDYYIGHSTGLAENAAYPVVFTRTNSNGWAAAAIAAWSMAA